MGTSKMHLKQLISLKVIFLIALTACSESRFSNVLDSKVAKKEDLVKCKIASSVPETSALRMAASGGLQNFVVGGVHEDCEISWRLNGVLISGQAVSREINSSMLASEAVNVLEAVVRNGTSSDSKSWEITKNKAPTCVVKSPSANPEPFIFTIPKELSAAAVDPDGDAVTGFTWKMNDVLAQDRFTNVITTAVGSSSTFTSNQMGTHKVALTFSDGLDSGECSWTMNMSGGCSIDALFPATATNRMANSGGTKVFSATINNSACTPLWTLNGTPLAGAGLSRTITSGQLVAGTNTLTLSISNGISSDTESWTIEKNNPPTCSSRTPASNPSAFAAGSTQPFAAAGTDADGDTLVNFAWRFNDASFPSLFSSMTATGGGTGSSVVFTPGSSQVGAAQKVSLVFSDGLDAGECSWIVPITNQCMVASSFPPTSTHKVANAESTTQTFSVVPNDVSCGVSWTLNGNPLSSSNPTQVLTSAQFLTGSSNTLIASLSNGTSTVTRTWTVSKNSVPACVVKVPSTNPAPFSYNNAQNLTAIANDPDMDAVSGFEWKYNDSSNFSSLFTNVSNTVVGSSATFSPTSGQIGTSQKISLTFTDGLDRGECSWNMNITDVCTILSSSPPDNNFKMPAVGGSQDFTVGANSSACTATWTFNGATLGGSDYTRKIESASLNPSNTLSVTISNGTSSSTRSWSIQKNIPPTCGTKTPATNPAPFAFGTTRNLSAEGTDTDGDTLKEFVWKFNDAVAPALFSNITNISNGRSADFTPAFSQIGPAQKVSLSFSDGYDSAECAWTMNISNQCSLVSSLPSTSTYKMASAGTNSQTYTVVPNDASCAVTWTLNGSPIGSSSPHQLITSSQLNNGAGNMLVATMSNGTSTATRTWNIARNQIPSCAGKTPATDPAPFIYTDNTRVFSATAQDPDGDAFTSFSWRFNDSATPSNIFTSLTPASPTTSQQMRFAPTTSQIGNGQKLSLVFSDGYDSGECYWNFNLANQCSIVSSSPTTTTHKVANSSIATQNYVIIPNDSSCIPSWTLNGSPISGTNSIQTIAGSSLVPGSGNTLSVQISNGVSTSTRSWAITRNQIPACLSQIPASNPSSFPYTTNTNVFSGTGSDPDGDALSSFIWKFNDSSNPPGIYSSLSPITPTTTQSMTFVPTSNQVGAAQKLSLTFNDGYDSGECYWNFGITDPNTVSLVSCNPNANPIVLLSSGGPGVSDRDLIINVLNGTAFRWTRDGASITNSTSLQSVSSTSLAAQPSNYVFRAFATDALNSPEVNCTFNVKRNGPPARTAASPDNSRVWRVAQGSTMGFSVTASDPNNDNLTYIWRLDGSVQNSFLNSTTNSATFNPHNVSLVTSNNPHTLSVEVTDGNESFTHSWTVEVNHFSNQCNTLFNGTVAEEGGKVCTLSGLVGVGDGRIPASNQSNFRIQPMKVIEDAYGNWFFSDSLNQTVSFWNRSGRNPFDGTYSCGQGNSTCPVTVFGKTALGASSPGSTGGVVTLVGNGTPGISDEDAFNTLAKLNMVGGGLALDDAERFLYIADYNNNRVVRVDGRAGPTLGQVKTILGQVPGAATLANNAAGNTEGAQGINHICTGPADVILAGESPNKFLYVTCYGLHAVKRMKAAFSDGDAVNYGRTFMVSGSLTSNQVSWGTIDGPIGITYGASRTVNPWSLAKDSNHNVYWIERDRAGLGGFGGVSGSRVRVFNAGSTPLTFFGGTTTEDISSWIALYYNEHTNASIALGTLGSVTALGSNGFGIQPYSSRNGLTTAPVTRVRITGTDRFLANTCNEYRMTALNNSNQLVIASSDRAVSVSITGTGDLFSDANCTMSAGVIGGSQGSRTVSILAGTHGTVFYYRATSAQSINWTIGTTNGITAASMNSANFALTPYGFSAAVVASAAGAQNNAALYGPREIPFNACVPYKLQLRTSTGDPSNATANRFFRFSTNTFGSFYSDSNCTTISTNATIATGTSETTIYYKTAVVIPTGEVGSLLGFPNPNTNTPTSAYPAANQNLEYGGLTFNLPGGLEVYEQGGLVRGFFISASNVHRVLFMNNTNGPITIGGNTIPAYRGGVVLGGTSAAADGPGLGVATRINTPGNLSMNRAQNQLLVTDQNNFRVRSLDVTGSEVNDTIGSGFGRSGNLGASITKTNEMFYSSPTGLAVDNANRRLYISDPGSRYIRVLDLLQGNVNTFAGNGSTNMIPSNGSNPTLISMNSPRGLTMHTAGGNPFLLYVDTANSVSATAGLHWDNSTGGADQFCYVGGFNLGSTSTQFFPGAGTVSSNRYFNALGDMGLGCGPYGTGTFSRGALTYDSFSLFNPEGIASDGTNFYVTNRQDHCILKVMPNGSSQVVVGTGTGSNVRCHQTGLVGITAPTSTATAGQASSSSVVIRYPTAIAIDPRFAADGNFFFADTPDLNSGSMIRYANFRSTSVTVGNQTVNGTSVPGEPYIRTITFVQYMNPPTQGGANYATVNGLAAVTVNGVTQMCVAGGRFDNAMIGSHNITCYAVSTSSGATSRIIGGTPSTALDVRSGAALGTEQEGVVSDNPSVKLFAPYGLVFDSDGNLYFSERGSHSIRMVKRWW